MTSAATRKPGAPRKLKDAKRKDVYLDTDSIEFGTRLGNGNLSEGVREALRRARDSETAMGRAGAERGEEGD